MEQNTLHYCDSLGRISPLYFQANSREMLAHCNSCLQCSYISIFKKRIPHLIKEDLEWLVENIDIGFIKSNSSKDPQPDVTLISLLTQKINVSKYVDKALCIDKLVKNIIGNTNDLNQSQAASQEGTLGGMQVSNADKTIKIFKIAIEYLRWEMSNQLKISKQRLNRLYVVLSETIILNKQSKCEIVSAAINSNQWPLNANVHSHFLSIVGKHFRAPYLSHVAQCGFSCGTLKTFKTIVKSWIQESSDSLSLKELKDAVQFVSYRCNKLSLKWLPKGKRENNLMPLREGLMLLTPFCAKFPLEKERTLLMKLMIQGAMEPIVVGKNRIAPQKDPVQSQELEIVERQDQYFLWLPELITGEEQGFQLRYIPPLVSLSGYESAIRKHTYQRILWFLEVCVAAYDDHRIYSIADTYLQDERGNNTDNTQAAHSSVIPAFDRMNQEGIKQEAKFGGVWHRLKLLHRINGTVILPKACNDVDTLIDGKRGTGGLRDVAIGIINRVAQGFSPSKGCEEFVAAWLARLTNQSYFGNDQERSVYIRFQISLAEDFQRQLHVLFSNYFLSSWPESEEAQELLILDLQNEILQDFVVSWKYED